MNEPAPLTLPPDLVDRLQAGLAAPYPPSPTLPAWDGPSAALSNLLRSGPRRKSLLLFDAVGDHDYDEAMSTDVEFDLDAQGLVVYKQALRWAESLLGPGRRPDPVPDGLQPPDPDDFAHLHDRVLDGVGWTEEAEGGALSADCRRWRCWDHGADWVCLQAGKWQGDGNFAVFVVMTVVPKPSAGDASVDDAGEAGEVDDTLPPAPACVRALQRQLGFALRQVPEEGETGGLMPRDVMNIDGSYTVDAAGCVTGLNLVGCDLVDTHCLQGFTDLRRLNLADNALVAPEGLGHLRRLQELSLRGNLLQRTPELEALAPLLTHPVEWAWERALFH